jgi:DNA-binding GntR family transcriptional regulator
MGGKPLERTFLVEGAYEAILGRILEGELAGGSAVSEVELARSLGVSRTPVHLALARLSREGLVDHPPGRKPRIARIGKEEVVEIYEMRLLLETAAVDRAVEGLAPAVLEDLLRTAHELITVHADTPSWIRRALDFDVRFHDALAASAGNRRLREEIAKYRLLVRAFCRVTGDALTLRQALQEHLAVLKALQARNPAVACQQMAKHLQNRLDAVLARLFKESK